MVFCHLNKIPTSVYSSFTFVFSENVFCHGMVVVLNPFCILVSEMRRKCCSFRDLMTSKTLALIDMKIIEVIGPIYC